MPAGGSGRFREFEQFVRSRGGGRGTDFAAEDAAHRRGAGERSDELQPGHDVAAIAFVLQVVGHHLGRLRDVAGRYVHAAARARIDAVDADVECGVGVYACRALGRYAALGAQQPDLDAQVGERQAGRAAHEGGGLERGSRKQTLAKQEVLQRFAHLRAAVREHVVDRGVDLGLEADACHQVVLQVLADFLIVEYRLYAPALQQCPVSQARNFEELRRAHRAGAKDDFPRRPRFQRCAPVRVGDAAGLQAVERNFPRVRAGQHREVGAFAYRLDVAVGGAAAQAVARGKLQITRAVGCGIVVVLDDGVAHFSPAGEERVRYRVRLDALHADRAAAPARTRGAECAVLQLAKVGQAVGVAPPGAAVGRHPVVHRRMPAHEEHAVHRARTAQAAAADPLDRLAVILARGHGVDAPEPAVVVQQLAHAQGDPFPHSAARAARFEEQHRGGGVFRQAAGEYRASRSRPDHNVVECVPIHVF